MPLQRRRFIREGIVFPALVAYTAPLFSFIEPVNNASIFKRVRPGDAEWPSSSDWEKLKKALNGNLIRLESPFIACSNNTDDAACKEAKKNLQNPYFLGDSPALTQSSGWLDAWQSEMSVYAVAAKTTADVAAAVNFAREKNLRLVIKGGGHSYQGTSNAADSLLIWTRALNNITLHNDFVASGCEGKQSPQPAVTIGSGAIWGQVYNAVITKAGRYVQGGGCLTVGVAGLITGGGFGSFSKYYGLAAAALLEAEIITADGDIKIANACTNPELFWALKGGGGGSFGVVTKLTLRTRELPAYFGAVFGKIKARSDESFKKLISRLLELYKEKFFNAHWGEQIVFHPDNTINLSMLFHGLTQDEAQKQWQAFDDWVKASADDYSFESPLTIIAVPAQHLWDVDFLKKHAPQTIIKDARPNAPEENVYWATNKSEAGQFLYAYQSAWLHENLLEKNNIAKLTNALYNASRHWTASLHFNKGLAGAPGAAINDAKDTAINPEVLNAFALIIIAGEGAPAFKTMPGNNPDVNKARKYADRIKAAMNEIRKIAPGAGSYFSESDFFEQHWQTSFWGDNYKRLAQVKKKYDPEGLFFIHHGVGSEEWSSDGFTRIS